MSRVGNLMGAFYVEGAGAPPWTAEDEARLQGQHYQRLRDGRTVLLDPHVVTPGGLFFVGRVAPPARGTKCSSCGACKVRPLPEAQGEGTWCSGCGRRWWT